MTHETQQSSSAKTISYSFSAPELARLATYRAAIVAGFYNEQLGSAGFPVRQTLRAGEGRNA